MCRSVPQMPVRSTLISTSLMPISGTGTSSSHRPGSALLLTSAFMVFTIHSLEGTVRRAAAGVRCRIGLII